MSTGGKSALGFRGKLHEIIFEADTPLGKIFDTSLLICILVSVLIIILDSVHTVHERFSTYFLLIEWILTGLFTIEYGLRIYCIGRPWKYICSFYGLVDLMSILPTYFGLFLTGKEHSLVVIRSLRLLRIFRLFKLARYVNESRVLVNGLRKSLPKITVFIGAVSVLVVIISTIMFMLEGSYAGTKFNSIPRCMYWAISTLSTVGYGDLSPMTAPGQIFASLVMLCGYGIIAVPPAIVTIGMVESFRSNVDNRSCHECGREGHEPIAKFCYACGASLSQTDKALNEH